MAYCTKCGKELRDGDRFCANCGAEVCRTSVSGTESCNPGMGNSSAENWQNQQKKQGRKKMTIVIGSAMVVLVLAIIAVVFAGKELVSDMGKDRTEYVVYTNDKVLFSVNYPEGYTITEPAENNVLITDPQAEASDFQVSVEYAFYNTQNCAIYDAADFAGQVEQNPKILTGWLGTDTAKITDSLRSEIGGRSCYEYDFEVEIKDDLHTGKLYIFDSDGEFGCYSYLQMMNTNAKKAKIYEMQLTGMEESFRINGSYAAENYSLYSYDDLKFLVRDDAAEGGVKRDQKDGDIDIYPFKGVFSEGHIIIGESRYDEEEDINTVLERLCNYYFSYKDRTKYVSQPTKAEYGRYPYTSIQLEFYEKGKKFHIFETVFLYDGVYWEISMKSSDENLETVSEAFSDVLFSLKFINEQDSEDDAASESVTENDSEDIVREVIEKIEGQQGYIDKGTWEPLAVIGDFNEDGTKELLAVYPVKNGNTFEEMYDLWRLENTRVERIKSEILFKEVGGNYGTAGIVKTGDIFYLAVIKKEPAGENFNFYYSFIPWNPKESRLGEEEYYMESHGTYGEEEKGRYILGDSVVDKDTFDAKMEEFSDWIYMVDLAEGAGSGGAKTFEELK